MSAPPRRPDLKGDWGWLAFATTLPAKNIPVNGITAATQLFKGRCIAIGCALQNTGTSGGNLTVYDGEDANGENAGIYGYAGNNTLKQTFGLAGVLHEIGVVLSPSAGTLTGALWVVPLWHYPFTAPGE